MQINAENMNNTKIEGELKNSEQERNQAAIQPKIAITTFERNNKTKLDIVVNHLAPNKETNLTIENLHGEKIFSIEVKSNKSGNLETEGFEPNNNFSTGEYIIKVREANKNKVIAKKEFKITEELTFEI